MTDKHIDNLEQAIRDMNRSDSRQRDTIYDQRQEIAEMKDKLSELNYKQNQLHKILDKIPAEVLEKMRNEERQKRKESREER